jgi:hypothetical protein
MGARGEEEVTVMRRALGRFVASTGLVGVFVVSALAVGVTPASAAGECPNAAFRTGYSAALPDCRAYELVNQTVQPFYETFGSEDNSHLADAVVGSAHSTFASESSTASGLAFFSTFAPPGSTTDGPFYLSSRGPDGWIAPQNLIPPQQTEVTNTCLPYMIDWSAGLERGVLADGYTTSGSGNKCGADEPEIVPGEPRGNQNLFLRDSVTGAYQLIDQAPLSGPPAPALYQAGSRNLTVVAFSEEARLTPEAPATEATFESELDTADYYVWAGGSVDRLLTILPNGQPTVGAIANAATFGSSAIKSPTFSHAMAPNGSRIAFTADGDLFSRVNPAAAQSAFSEPGECDEPSKGCTVQIDASETGEPGGGGVFEGSSGEGGEVVLFSDANRLTSDSTAESGELDLYEYDFSKPVGERLTDLTVDANAGEHVGVLGYVGNSQTGSPGDYVYFVATGVLASNKNSDGGEATSGAPNLYLAHAGTRAFIATLSAAEDNCDWSNVCMTARVSPNGRFIGFDSIEQLTGFDNLDARTSQPDQEIFLYDAEADGLTCASCGTTGSAPTGPASIRTPEGTSAKVPTPSPLQRNVNDSGQVFFDTKSHLLEAARNEVSNVYEYEDGQLHLLSSGTAEAPSYFYEASADGGDVYLITQQALVSGAGSAELAIFDAKVDGGFPASSATSTEPCSGEACAGTQSIAPRLPAISSTSTIGSGNLGPAIAKPAATKSLTSAQKLAKALKSCRTKRAKHKRAVCETQARKRYGTHARKSAESINRRGK